MKMPAFAGIFYIQYLAPLKGELSAQLTEGLLLELFSNLFKEFYIVIICE